MLPQYTGSCKTTNQISTSKHFEIKVRKTEKTSDTVELNIVGTNITSKPLCFYVDLFNVRLC